MIYKVSPKHQKALTRMMTRFIKEYKTSNSVVHRDFLREEISFLAKVYGKDEYTQPQRERLNRVRANYLRVTAYDKFISPDSKHNAGNTNISSKGIGSIIKNGDNQ